MFCFRNFGQCFVHKVKCAAISICERSNACFIFTVNQVTFYYQLQSYYRCDELRDGVSSWDGRGVQSIKLRAFVFRLCDPAISKLRAKAKEAGRGLSTCPGLEGQKEFNHVIGQLFLPLSHNR